MLMRGVLSAGARRGGCIRHQRFIVRRNDHGQPASGEGSGIHMIQSVAAEVMDGSSAISRLGW